MPLESVPVLLDDVAALLDAVTVPLDFVPVLLNDAAALLDAVAVLLDAVTAFLEFVVLRLSLCGVAFIFCCVCV